MNEKDYGFHEIKNDKLLKFKNRLIKTFLNAFFIITIAFILILVLKGHTLTLIISYLFILILAFVYSIISVRTILNSIRFYYNQKKVEIIIEKYNSKKSITFNVKEINITVSQDLSSKLEVWRLYIKKNEENIIAQRDIAGWTKDLFLEIEKNYRKCLN